MEWDRERGRPVRAGQYRGEVRGWRAQERAEGEEVGDGENTTIGRECAGVRVRLRGGGSGAREGTKPGSRFGLDSITHKTDRTEDLSRP